jgi:hypothetical protein
MNNKIIAIVIGIVVIGVGSFYAGTKYAKAKSSSGGSFANFANLSPEERQARFAAGGAGTNMGQRGMRNGGGFTTGEILSKDDKSITVKLMQGGSKIIFMTMNTPIMKSIAGSVDDLKVGEQVTVTGTTNSDGSLSAQMIQLRSGTPPTR